MKPGSRFFRNQDCEYFPCHQGVAREDFNCLFCFCPLYFLPACGGNFEMRRGVKDCTRCARPHEPGGYDRILARLRQEADTRRKQADQKAAKA